MGRRGRKKLPQDPVETTVESLGHDGRGVTHIAEKATFIHGALPGERVLFRCTGKRKNFDEGEVLEVLDSSVDRVTPKCPHFGLCGGCSLQHQSASAQINAKQEALLEALQHTGKVAPAEVLSPLTNESPWGYRRKARLGVKYVIKKGRVLVGFRERGTSFVADLSKCHVLHPKVGMSLDRIRELVETLDIKDRVPQVEVAMDDHECVLIFRVLTEPVESDLVKLKSFGEQHDFHIYIQPGGPDSVRAVSEVVQLSYQLPAFDLRLEFLPTDFTQVNSEINRQMITRAVQMLEPEKEDRILDLFCGIGNFTLPLATRAGRVTGVEGDIELVKRAGTNAHINGINNVDFRMANLYGDLSQESWLREEYDKALLDPPRSGAQEILEHLPELGVQRLLYISCYPGTLARDAGELVHNHGYELLSAGVMDMFPHTAHVESIALFEKR